MKKAPLIFLASCVLCSVAGCQSDPFGSSFGSSYGSPYEKKSTLQTIADFPKSMGRAFRKDRSTAVATNSQQLDRHGMNPRASSDGASQSPAAAVQILQQGNKAFDNGELQQAAASYDVVLRFDPDNVEAHHRRAVVADLMQDYQTAERHYQQALRQRPNDPDLLSDVGYSYLLQRRFTESERYLRQAINVSPNHRLAQNHLGVLMRDTGNLQQAMAYFQQAGNHQEIASLKSQLSRNMYASNQQPDPGRNAAMTGWNGPVNHQQPIQQTMAYDQNSNGGFQNSWPHDAFNVAASQQTAPYERQASRESVPAPGGVNEPVGLTGSLAEFQQMNVPDHNINDVLRDIDNGGNNRSTPAELGAPVPAHDPRAVVVAGNPGSMNGLGYPNQPASGNPNVMHLGQNDQMLSAQRHASRVDATTQQQSASWGNANQYPSGTAPVRREDFGVPYREEGVQPAGFSSGSTVVDNQAGSNGTPVTDQQAATKAAYLGMNAGFGQPFPVSPRYTGQPAGASSFPSTNSRLNGAQYPQPPRQMGSQQQLSVPASLNDQPFDREQAGTQSLEMWPGRPQPQQVQQNNQTPEVSFLPPPNDSRAVQAPVYSDPLSEYESQIQRQNAEIDRLRQQLDSSRAHLMRQ